MGCIKEQSGMPSGLDAVMGRALRASKRKRLTGHREARSMEVAQHRKMNSLQQQ